MRYHSFGIIAGGFEGNHLLATNWLQNLRERRGFRRNFWILGQFYALLMRILPIK